MNHLNSQFSSTTSYWSSPDLSQAAFIAPNAVVIGQVLLAAGASIWYGAVVRGDIER
ncbi:MAG: gamma carbonic anhydrase family protein, partial [Microcoleus sp. SIO2G3]|nr:gamma carbonic anhydrase family protein [Microcoleus sp. SIO2G3]